MDGIADLLDSEPGQHPVPAPQSTVATVDPPARAATGKRRRSPLVAAALVAVVGFVAAFLVGRVTAPERVVAVQAPPASQAESWMPDCTATPGDRCQVETVVRRFMAAWQNGQPLTPFTSQGAQIPQRVPRGDLTRTPQVAVTGPTAIVLWWTASDGMFTVTLENYSGEWRVAQVAG